MGVALEIGALVYSKLQDLLFDKGIEGVKNYQFDKSLNELKDKLNDMAILEANGWGGAFYNYVTNYNVVEKIIQNYLYPDVFNGTNAINEIKDECIVYIKKNKGESVSFDPNNEIEVKETIEKLNSCVYIFFTEIMTKEQIVEINIISKNLSNILSEQTKEITEDTLEIIKKANESIRLLNKDVISLKDLSWATKKSFVDRFKKEGVFEESIDFDKKMTAEEMYIKPSLKLYNNNAVDSKYSENIDISVDTLIEAFVSHTDEKSFVEKLETGAENKIFINEIFKCFYSSEYNYKKIDEHYKKILFIYGDAGTGKSMFVLNQCNENLNNDNIYVLEMKHIKVENHNIKYDNKKITFQDIKDNSVLFLDGFDETVYNNEIIKIIDDKIKYERVHNFKIIVTSRIDYNVDESLKKHTMYTKLSFLSNDEIYEYMEMYFKNYQLENSNNYNLFKTHIEKEIEDENEELTISGSNEVSENGTAFNMYKIPILLYMFSNNLVRETIKNPDLAYSFEKENKYTLYKGIFGKDGYIYKDKGDVLKGTRESLKNVSLEMFRQNQLDVEIDTKLLKNKLNMEFNINNRVGAGEFYLKVDRLKFKFYHKSFYEYFVAEKMADKIVDLIINFNKNEKEEVEQFLNIFFGLNYITKEIYYFLTEIIKDKYSEGRSIELDTERYEFFEDETKDKNKFITFFRRFAVNLCLPISFDGKYNISRSNADEIMTNTFFNVTTIIIRILSESTPYKSKTLKGINVLGINKESDIYMRLSIKSLVLLNAKKSIVRFFNDFSIGDVTYDLSQVAFADTHLSNSYLAGVKLRNTDLRGADLSNVVLRNADLVEANLRGVDLRTAALVGADLTDADLRYADLRYADLTTAKLVGADLRGAKILKIDIKNWTLTEQQIKARGVEIVDFRPEF